MSDNAMTSKDSIKFWTFLTIMLLGVAIAVTLIDLTIKAAILSESTAMKLAMEEWEVRNGQEISGRNSAGNHSNSSDNGNLPIGLLDTGNAGVEEGSDALGNSLPSNARTGNGRKPRSPRRD